MSSESMSTVSTPVDKIGDMSVHQGGLTPGQRTRADSPSLAASTAAELLRLALLANLAVDLGDPVLARRAARRAETAAHLLAGLDWQAPDLHNHEDDQPLPDVDDLLERMPRGESA